MFVSFKTEQWECLLEIGLEYLLVVVIFDLVVAHNQVAKVLGRAARTVIRLLLQFLQLVSRHVRVKALTDKVLRTINFMLFNKMLRLLLWVRQTKRYIIVKCRSCVVLH